MNLMLIDDDRDFLSLFGNVLRKLGYQVRTAPDGLTALQTLDEFPSDLVISDVMMKDTSVMSLTCLLKKSYPQLPIILISAYADEPLIKNTLVLGADAFLPKPVCIPDLQASIMRLAA